MKKPVKKEFHIDLALKPVVLEAHSAAEGSLRYGFLKDFRKEYHAKRNI